jgi:uncharacterized protein (TIGR02246 family)
MEYAELQNIMAMVHRRWAECFSPLNPQAMAQNYTTDAILFGSAIPPFIGREQITAYFAQLPKGLYVGVAFAVEHLTALTPDVISMAGSATFLRKDTSPLEVRITHVIVQQNGKWLIASHHVSPKVVL